MRKYRCSLALFFFCLAYLSAQDSKTPVLPDWLTQDDEIRAGLITVPENHQDPKGRTIHIAYAVLKSKKPKPNAPPLIFFSGGPGGQTINRGMVGFLKEHVFLEDRDIILFDQRGIGYSSALPDMSYASFHILAADASPEEEMQLTQAMLKEYQEKCRDMGIRPEFYNTLQNAQDVGRLFEHLGYSKYILYGGSYGTRIARVVQDQFPEYIHSAVLDSPSPLSGDFLLNRLASFSQALDRILEYCGATTECRNEYPNLRSEYFKAIARLKEDPLRLTLNDSIPFVINEQDGIYLIRRLLYQDNSREKAPELIRALLNGGGPVIDQVLKFEYELTGALNLTMLLSVERFEQFDPGNTAGVIEASYRTYPLIPEKLGFFDAFYQAGMNWHTATLPMDERGFLNSEIPTLILVNRYDPVTPPSNGYLFKEKLSRGLLLVLDEGGHGGGNETCKEKVMADFMNNPDIPPDLSCLNLVKE